MTDDINVQWIVRSVDALRTLAELRRHPQMMSASTLSALAGAETRLNQEIELFFGLPSRRTVAPPTETARSSSVL